MRRKEQDVTCNSLARKENERVEERKRKEDGLAPTGVNEGGFLLTFISFFPSLLSKNERERRESFREEKKEIFNHSLFCD